MHTRTESTDNLPAQFQATRSRVDLPSQLYQQSPSTQVSRIDVQQSPAQYTRSKHGSGGLELSRKVVGGFGTGVHEWNSTGWGDEWIVDGGTAL